jgi:hypothetical protein
VAGINKMPLKKQASANEIIKDQGFFFLFDMFYIGNVPETWFHVVSFRKILISTYFPYKICRSQKIL